MREPFLVAPHRVFHTLGVGAGIKTPASIIRCTFAFDSKNGLDSGCPKIVTRFVERDKNYFRKIEICHKLLSFFAENWIDFSGFGW